MDKIKLSGNAKNIEGLPNQVNLLKSQSIKTQVFFEDIKDALTGIGRVVKYVKENSS